LDSGGTGRGKMGDVSLRGGGGAVVL
jgi:hypothetical protein